MENYDNIEDLIKLAKAHDRQAQEKIISLYTPFIKRIVRYYGLFLSKEDREDLFIEALFATLKTIDYYSENVGRFEDFLFINIRNRILDILKTRKVEVPIENVLSKTSNFLDDINLKEEIEEFENTLTENELEVFKLYLEGLKISQIASYLNRDYKSVDNTLQRIKKKAKKFMESI